MNDGLRNTFGKCRTFQLESEAKGFEVASKYAERRGDYSAALEFHQRLMQETGWNYSNCLRAGWLHFQAEGFRRSLDFYKAAAACVPNACEPVLGALECCVAMGNADDAEQYLDIAVRRYKSLAV